MIIEVSEWCPHCETKIYFNVRHLKEIHECSICKEYILPCSLCDFNDSNIIEECNKCEENLFNYKNKKENNGSKFSS